MSRRSHGLDRLDLLFAIDAADGDDRFTANPPGEGFLYGGMTLGLAVRAAAATVADGLQPKSLHTMFQRAGQWGPQLDLAVERLSDSRSFSTRSVTLSQFGQTLATSLVSFHVPDAGNDWQEPAPVVARPESLEGATVVFGSGADPVEVRQVFPIPPLAGEIIHPYWAKPRLPLPADPLLSECTLAFISDYMVIYSPFARGTGAGKRQISRTLEHALWFHRPFVFDDWLLFSCEPLSVTGGRYVSRGQVHDQAGALVASFAQEGLIRPMSEKA